VDQFYVPKLEPFMHLPWISRPTSLACMEPAYPPQKKGLGGLAWLGIGCGGVVVLGVILTVLVSMFFGARINKLPKQGEEPRANRCERDDRRGGDSLRWPRKMTPPALYCPRQAERQTHHLYWDAKAKTVKNVEGDFSAIPAEADAPGTPAPQ